MWDSGVRWHPKSKENASWERQGWNKSTTQDLNRSKLRSNLLKDTLKENCNTGGTIITELEWGFHGLRTGVSSAVGADGPEETTQLHISLVGSPCNADGSPSNENVGELALKFINVGGWIVSLQNSHGEALTPRTSELNWVWRQSS